jgi:hypothetical protein
VGNQAPWPAAGTDKSSFPKGTYDVSKKKSRREILGGPFLF